MVVKQGDNETGRSGRMKPGFRERDRPDQLLRKNERSQPGVLSQALISLAAMLAWLSSLPMVKKPWNWPGK